MRVFHKENLAKFEERGFSNVKVIFSQALITGVQETDEISGNYVKLES